MAVDSVSHNIFLRLPFDKNQIPNSKKQIEPSETECPK